MLRLIKVIAIALFLAGCTSATVVTEVLIPVRCDVEVPQRPQPTEPSALWVTDLVSYTLMLEAALAYCVGRLDHEDD